MVSVRRAESSSIHRTLCPYPAGGTGGHNCSETSCTTKQRAVLIIAGTMAIWYATYKSSRDALEILINKALLNCNLFTVTAGDEPHMIKATAPAWMSKFRVRSELGRAGPIDKLADTIGGLDSEIVITYINSSRAEKVADGNDIAMDNEPVTIRRHGRHLYIKDFPSGMVENILSLKFWDRSIVSIHMSDIRRIYTLNAAFYLRELRDDPLFSDMSITAGKRLFRVHRSILAKASDYFNGLLLSDPNMCNITLDDTDDNVFSEVLDLIYGKEIIIDGEKTINMLFLAHKLYVRAIDWRRILPLIDIENNRNISASLITLISLVYPDPRQMPPEIEKVVLRCIPQDTA